MFLEVTKSCDVLIEEMTMNGCSREFLLRLLKRQLDLDDQLDLFDHLDGCEDCRRAIYQMSKDRDRSLYGILPVTREKRTAA